MDRPRIHEGICRTGFPDALGHAERSELSQVEAAELLGNQRATSRRWRDRYREDGSARLADRRLRRSLRRVPLAEYGTDASCVWASPIS